MKPTSTICFINFSSNDDSLYVKNQIVTARDSVSEGRYAIFVFEAPSDWESHMPIESFIVKLTLGDIANRSADWEFFGNGVIRTYSGRNQNYENSYQWLIVRRSGDKPYSRKKSFTSNFLRSNAIPVAHKVFTRDVANNVWHLKTTNFKKRIVQRFSALLVWQDEILLLVDNNKVSEVKNRQALNLEDDLIGVPTKIEYFWNNGSTLF